MEHLWELGHSGGMWLGVARGEGKEAMGSMGSTLGGREGARLLQPFKHLEEEFGFYPVHDGKYGRVLMENETNNISF